MARFSQSTSPLKIYTPQGEDLLLPITLTGSESLGGTFSFTIGAVAPKGSRVSFREMVGKPASATVALPGGIERAFHGIVSRFTRHDSDSVFDHYGIELRPRLHALSLVKRSRVFQNLSAIDIIRQLLASVGGAEFDLASRPPARVTCAQFRETDLEFFLRLCSEEGLIHYWRHTRDNHHLVITDSTARGPSTGAVAYDNSVGGSLDACRVRSWSLSQSLVPVAVEVGGSHMQMFGQSLGASAPGPEAVVAGSVRLEPAGNPGPWEEDGHSPARYFDSVTVSGGDADEALGMVRPEQERRARLLATAAAADSVRAHAEGDCSQLTAGHAVELQGHPDQSGHWLTVTVSHRLSVEGSYWAGEPASLIRRVSAELAPLDLPQAHWPPLPKPRVGGVCTATVVGPGPMNIDKFGRVQVNFPWDRSAGGESCWVRVAQSWAGKGWGACFWPRVGHEVVVAFEEGDPDRPVIVGSVYNGANTPPYPMPQSMYIAGWKSLTQDGDPSSNYHQILMSDEKGAEVVHIHAEGKFITQQESANVSRKPGLDINFQG